MINFNPEPTTSTPELTSEVAQAIYALIKTHGDADKAYKLKGNSDFEPEHFTETVKEAERIFSEIAILKSGTKVMKEAVYETNEEGEQTIVSEAEYFVPENDLDILSQLSSDLLDCEQLLIDSK